jgi:osmotically-inducible protein OsmY
MKTDVQLKQDIDAELRWDPKLDAAQVGVSVDKGAVSMFGSVDTYAETWAAVEAAKRVSGVRTVAQDLTVKITGAQRRTDSALAAAVQHALAWDVHVPKTVTARVRDGVVTLEGTCVWGHQREGAERAVRYLTGVVAVANTIVVKPDVSATHVKEQVESALERHATSDTNSIEVESSGGQVTLSGTASSWQSIRDASHAAWAAPGVTDVVDQLSVTHTF